MCAANECAISGCVFSTCTIRKAAINECAIVFSVHVPSETLLLMNVLSVDVFSVHVPSVLRYIKDWDLQLLLNQLKRSHAHDF